MIWLLRPDQPKPREFAPAITEATEILPGLPAVMGKPVHVAFDGGRLTSDAGILLQARFSIGALQPEASIALCPRQQRFAVADAGEKLDIGRKTAGIR